MGLLDQVLGTVLGVGQGSAATSQQGSSTMSPIVKSILLHAARFIRRAQSRGGLPDCTT